MLFEIDSQYGHIVVDSPQGPVYQADGVLVDEKNPRPCAGCNARIEGGHDPCIADLPDVYQACCGHGLDRTSGNDRPNGYVAFKNGRCMRFSGLLGGERIRLAVEAVNSGDALPDGFQFDETRAWWEGLTDEQRSYVQQNIPRRLAAQVLKVTGSPGSQAFQSGEAPWFDGLKDEHKEAVWANLGTMLADLVQESLIMVG